MTYNKSCTQSIVFEVRPKRSRELFKIPLVTYGADLVVSRHVTGSVNVLLEETGWECTLLSVLPNWTVAK